MRICARSYRGECAFAHVSRQAARQGERTLGWPQASRKAADGLPGGSWRESRAIDYSRARYDLRL
jgi:hypothetical protein